VGTGSRKRIVVNGHPLSKEKTILEYIFRSMGAVVEGRKKLGGMRKGTQLRLKKHGISNWEKEQL